MDGDFEGRKTWIQTPSSHIMSNSDITCPRACCSVPQKGIQCRDKQKDPGVFKAYVCVWIGAAVWLRHCLTKKKGFEGGVGWGGWDPSLQNDIFLSRGNAAVIHCHGFSSFFCGVRGNGPEGWGRQDTWEESSVYAAWTHLFYSSWVNRRRQSKAGAQLIRKRIH